MNKKSIIITALAFLISLTLITLGSKPYSACAKILGINTNDVIPKELYRVYLADKSLGVIESKHDLENYIDSKQ